MALIAWDDSLSVGVAELDGQHRQLIGMINDLHAAMAQGEGRVALGTIIDRLAQYTQSHFGAEERYFAQLCYPQREAHQREHRELVARVSDFRAGFNEGRLDATIQVMRFLSQWLRTHIKGSDRQYAPFLAERGIQ